MNLIELKKLAGQTAGFPANIPLQITGRTAGTTAGGKPYIEIAVADASGAEKLRLWQETPAYRVLNDYPQMDKGTAIEVIGRWKVNQWGLNVEEPKIRALDPDEMNALFQGGAAFAEVNDECWEFIHGIFWEMSQSDHPLNPLGVVCMRLLESTEEPLRRAAAAHGVHHARRGGLLEHTASMLRVAVALAPCYPEATPEILYAGVLFHDIGKIFETDYQARGFALEPTLRGTLMGHISVGVTMLAKLWEIVHEEKEAVLRDHVAHLILSHHGQNEWGSPVEPKTPEAVLLHHIDMIDAGVEKLRNCYAQGESTAPGQVKAVYPMRGDLGLPFKTSAAFARMHISARLWVVQVADENREAGVNHTITREWYEEKFCEVLCGAGVTTGRQDYALLTRAVFETAVRRWDELQKLWPDLLSFAPTFPPSK